MAARGESGAHVLTFVLVVGIVVVVALWARSKFAEVADKLQNPGAQNGN